MKGENQTSVWFWKKGGGREEAGAIKGTFYNLNKAEDFEDWFHLPGAGQQGQQAIGLFRIYDG